MLSIALIDPLGDYGIGTYTYELGQGLSANGARVDAYVADASDITDVPLHPNHRRLLVLGSRLHSAERGNDTVAAPPSPRSVPQQSQPRRTPRWREYLRRRYLTVELALHLKRSHYDVVWTQWPEMESYPYFWLACRLLGMRMVHTVHNIFPHERRAGDLEQYGPLYAAADLLVVHSPEVQGELASYFPDTASKTVVISHGAYTIYPRQPHARQRLRAELDIPNSATVILFAGAIRPYKNIGAAIEAVAGLDTEDVLLVIAGREPGASRGDPLPMTRAHVARAGITSRVRFYPGYLDVPEMGALFEATDILVLPYLKSYGSGQLMLAVTFGKHVVATRTGMEDVLVRYPRAIALETADAACVKAGIKTAMARLRADNGTAYEVPPDFNWDNIGAESLRAIAGRLGERARHRGS